MHEPDDDPAGNAPSPEDPGRLHEVALAELKDALVPSPEVPPPPAGFDDRQIGALNETCACSPKNPKRTSIWVPVGAAGCAISRGGCCGRSWNASNGSTRCSSNTSTAMRAG